nr:hypothetical protein [Tanacetum cinerariifolium]
DNDIPAYTNRFQELALICNKFVSNETEKVDKYINGLPDNIYRNVKSSKPKKLDETIELANDLMDQKLRTYTERKSDSKRKTDDISRNNQQPFKRHNVAKAYNLGSAKKKTYEGNMPKCTKCQRNHSGPYTLKCHKCGKIGHYVRDCRSTDNTNATNNRGGNGPNPKGNGCFECGNPGHFKRDCPKLKNNNREMGMLKDGCMLWVMQRGMEMLRETRTQMSSRVDKYISGLPDNIYGNVKSSKPKTLDETIESTGNTNATNNRGGNGPNPRGNGCFECGNPGHFKRDCPKLYNKNGGNGNAQGWVYAVSNAERNGNAAGNPDSDVVTGTFLLKNRYASILFDTGADRSFVSTAFSSLIDIVPNPLDNHYDVELADGKIVGINTIIRG